MFMPKTCANSTGTACDDMGKPNYPSAFALLVLVLFVLSMDVKIRAIPAICARFIIAENTGTAMRLLQCSEQQNGVALYRTDITSLQKTELVNIRRAESPLQHWENLFRKAQLFITLMRIR